MSTTKDKKKKAVHLIQTAKVSFVNDAPAGGTGESMSRAGVVLAMAEKKIKTDYSDKVHQEDFDRVVANITKAAADLKEAGGLIKDKQDLEKFNRCLMGMKGTSSKVAEIAAKAKKDKK